MKSCVIRPHGAGFFSLFNNVLTCLALYDKVHVDWTGCPKYGTPEDGNIWEKFFFQIDPKDPEAEVIDFYPNQDITYKNAGERYLEGEAWRKKYHVLYKRITVRPEILKNVDQFMSGVPRNTIGLLVRAHSHAGEQLTDRSQPLDEYAEAIEKESPNRVYVACGDNETLEWFRERFDITYHPETVRAANRGDDVFYWNHGVEDARIVLEEVLILSRLKAFIHPVSNMATAALIMNPWMKSIFLK